MMDNWAIFVNTERIKLYQKYAGEIRFGPEYIYLKAEPVVTGLDNEIYGNWFYRTDNGVFLQKWHSVTEPHTSLIFINFETLVYNIIERDIKAVLWEMVEDTDYFYLNYDYGKQQLKIKK